LGRDAVSGAVAVRDLRDLPFFQVRLRAIEAIRATAEERSLARAIGFYAICCQLANEQRHTGEHRSFTSNYDELSTRARVARKTVRAMLATLDQAEVLKVELTPDLERGAVITTLHLPIQDGPFAAITVAMANRVAANHGRTIVRTGRGEIGGYLTRDLGMIATLIEFCVRQYGENNGARALLERAELARRTGLSIDSVDNCVKVLEALELLVVERRRGSNGGRFRPSIYSLIEPGQGALVDHGHRPTAQERQGGGSVTPTRSLEPCNPESENSQGRAPNPARTTTETENAEARSAQGGKSALRNPQPPPSIARARLAAEETIENTQPSPQQDQRPADVMAESQTGGQGSDRVYDAAVLCTRLIDTLAESRGPGPARRYDAEPDVWHAAAARILADHPIEKVLEAIAYLPRDQVIGTKVRSMPDLERLIEDLRHRAHAARAVTGGQAGRGASGAPGWPEAKALLMRAIQRHGGGGKAAAFAELEARHSQLRVFAVQVGWGSLCRDSFEKQDYVYRTSWDALTRQAEAEEAA